MDSFDQSNLDIAIEDLSMMPFFPADPGTRSAIMRVLAKMCPSLEALQWLTDTMVNRVRNWPGPAEMRGLLCSRYRPADGIDADCSLPGYSAADQEQQYLMRVDTERAAIGPPSEDPEMCAMIADLAERKSIPAPPGCCDPMGRRPDGAYCDCVVGQFAREVAARSAAEESA